MVRLKELINTLSDQNVRDRTFNAKYSKTCKICGRPAIAFRSPPTKMEYEISTICEECQFYFYLNEGNG